LQGLFIRTAAFLFVMIEAVQGGAGETDCNLNLLE
jgi:hypothetical protein